KKLAEATKKAADSDWGGSTRASGLAFSAVVTMSDSLVDTMMTAANATAWATGGNEEPEEREQAKLMRDIFGNPFRLIALDPTWQNSNVLALAQSVYDERAYDRMPILGDALEDAGCTNADILGHCRGPGPHVRGCWVVDLILGKK